MRFTFARTVLPALLVAAISSSFVQAAPPTQPPDPAAMENQLRQATGGTVRISHHAATGKVNYIGVNRDRALAAPSASTAALPNPEANARAFTKQYGALFGLSQQAQALRTDKIDATESGMSTVRFQQMFQNVPVMGGEINVNLDNKGNLLAMLGEVSPALSVSVTPTIDGATAQTRARDAVAKAHQIAAGELVASAPQLWIYDAQLLGAPQVRGPALVWRVEVTPTKLQPIKELVLIDAQRGVVALQVNQIHTARDRRTYTANNTDALPGTLKCTETTANCSPDETDAALAHVYAGQVYDFYKNRHNRDSVNNQGMPLVSTVDYCPDAANCRYENAFWDGAQMVYGDTYAAADDVVGHELTHGVTDFESRLFYYYQSGAINESFSDIWGEWLDLTNGRGNDAANVRWLIGEDLRTGAIRNMTNPGAFGHPDRMRSPNYWDSVDDGGGVHINSGVGNKAAVLLTDGGTFNGRSVSGLGIDKAAKIYYEAQTNLLVSGSDYNDLYNALRQACANVVGTAGITTADCQQVQNAVDATEMNLQPTSADAQAVDAPVCGTGQTPRDVFFDNFENPGANNWGTQTIVGANQWYYPQNSHPYTGFDATYATSGVRNVWGYNIDTVTDSAFAMRTGVNVPTGAFMHFRHAFSFETGLMDYDGGVVEYSINGGGWQDAEALFANNGYGGTLYSDNPLGARRAFVGESHGYYSSRLNLSSLAGKNVRFRFRIGTDDGIDAYGWFIDDVRFYTCGAPLPPQVYVPMVIK